MKKILPEIIPLLVSTGFAVLLWYIKVTSVGQTVIAGLLLELVIVSHKILLHVRGLYTAIGDVSLTEGLSTVPKDIKASLERDKRFSKVIVDCAVQDFSRHINQLARGKQRMSVDRFMSIAESVFATLTAQDQVLATSLFGGGDYWKVKFGAKYAEFNRDARARGAKIDRIFIFRDQAHFSEFKQILSQQLTYANVYYAICTDDALDDVQFRDILVINDEIGAEFNFSGPIITSADLITDRHEVKAMREQILQLRDKRSHQLASVD